MANVRTLWIFLAFMLALSFAILLAIGAQIYREMPPIPGRVVNLSGDTLFTADDIQKGQQVWQSIGGQELGSIWGHGALLAPDWSADFLNREATAVLELLSRDQHGYPFAELTEGQAASVRARMVSDIRTNTYRSDADELVVSDVRARAIVQVRTHYDELFGAAPGLEGLREDYAIPNNAIPDAAQRQALSTFFFWTSWAAGTNRPGEDYTYTSNWPPEPLIDNRPTAGIVMWSVASVILLLAAIGGLVWYYAVLHRRDEVMTPPDDDPLLTVNPTPSMRATAKYFWTAIAVFLFQIGLGVVTAHYAVEGHDFYGIPISDWIPYAVTRTWHIQAAIFWIATAWLGTGLYIAPAVSGHEPKFQALGVNILYIALLVVVVGSMAGEWLAVQRELGLELNFWFGHQGYEYVDLGRFWQTLLFVGLMIWLLLVGRAIMPALMRPSETRSLVAMLFASTLAIGLFYGAGFAWGEDTHLAMVEYWRWWVVHLWVEAFFEVFATVVIALLTVRLGLVRISTATYAVVFGTIVFLFGGILGTLHHLYFTATPTSVIAIGAIFSALEVAPLVLIGYEAFENYNLSKATKWVERYKWAILFFVAVAFWNLVGAGLFGFMINPPISLYYVQGLNLTPVHAHAALFGVYGMLGIGLMLFCLRGVSNPLAWDDRLLKFGFWTLNIGLAGMVTLSLLPIGILQASASISEGYAFARSAEFLQQPIIHFFVWMRVPGDVIFAVGGLTIGLFLIKLVLGGRGPVVQETREALSAAE
jgi:nitric oxide reductase subunit B